MQLVFIRHGLTAWNEQKRIQGRTDVALSERGVEQVSNWCIAEDWKSATCITSPLARTKQTAALLFKHKNHTEDVRLIETSWGDYEGRRLADLRADASLNFSLAEKQGLDFKPPGGESPREVKQRLQSFLNDYEETTQDMMIITHKGVIRAALSLAFDWDMRSKPPVKLDWNSAHVFTFQDKQLGFVQSVSMLT